MGECGIFVDESGDGSTSSFYLLTLVFHDQSQPIASTIARYEADLRVRGLPNIPFQRHPS